MIWDLFRNKALQYQICNRWFSLKFELKRIRRLHKTYKAAKMNNKQNMAHHIQTWLQIGWTTLPSSEGCLLFPAQYMARQCPMHSNIRHHHKISCMKTIAMPVLGLNFTVRRLHMLHIDANSSFLQSFIVFSQRALNLDKCLGQRCEYLSEMAENLASSFIMLRVIQNHSSKLHDLKLAS